MGIWIRLDTPPNAKAMLVLLVSGSFNGGSHPHCRLSTCCDRSVDVDLGEGAEEVLEMIRECSQIEEIGPLADVAELPDLWADRAKLIEMCFP